MTTPIIDLSDDMRQAALDRETQEWFPAALLHGDGPDPRIEFTQNGISIVDHAGRRIPLPVTRVLRQLAFQLERCADWFDSVELK